MKTYEEKIISIIMHSFVIGLASIAGGTILWLLWDGTISSIFPKAVSSGIIVENLEWWPAVKFVWIITILFKSTISNTTKKKVSKPEKQIL